MLRKKVRKLLKIVKRYLNKTKIFSILQKSQKATKDDKKIFKPH